MAISDDVLQKEEITRLELGDLKMVVKKHRMERNIHGELNDVGRENEGWPIYVLTPEQFAELEQGPRIIDGHAMIFIYAQIKLHYWDHHQVFKTHVPEDYRENLKRLYIQPKDLDGKVTQNTENMPLIVRVTKEMAHQCGLSHRYSPEFTFAHEFTRHYDEFAQYLPEFGRLKELSKISALIRYLNHIRESNQNNVQALDYLLSPTLADSLRENPAQRLYKTTHDDAKITTGFTSEDYKHLNQTSLKDLRELALNVMNMIDTVLVESSHVEINTPDPFVKEIGGQYIDFLMSKGMPITKVLNCSGSLTPEKLLTTQQLFGALIKEPWMAKANNAELMQAWSRMIPLKQEGTETFNDRPQAPLPSIAPDTDAYRVCQQEYQRLSNFVIEHFSHCVAHIIK